MIAIRPATARDEPAIRAIAEAAYARYIPAIGRRPAPMDADFRADIAAGHIHLAEDTAAVLGYLVCYPDPQGMLLDSVAVLPSAAGRGIGKALIGHCEDLARAQGLDAVHLYTNARMTENLAIYPHLGFTETDRRQDNGFDRVFFRKPL